MKLTEYLEREDISPQDFAATIGVDYTTVWRYLNGKAWPSRLKRRAIKKATDGAVQANDWDEG